MSESTGHEHEFTIKGGSIALSDLGQLLPGMAEVMPLVGERIWKCYYAGKARNKPLAKFQLSEAVNLMEKGAILRPKYAEDMEVFTSESVSAVRKCIESENWDELRTSLRGHDRDGQRLSREVRQGVPALEDARPAPA